MAAAKLHLFDALDTPLHEKRHVVDGGVLNNKPLRGALKAIFNVPRERSVRRVLAYINPDPGDGPQPGSIPDTPSLYSVLGASLFGIPQSQSIADQLQEIADHNRVVQLRRDNVLNIVAATSDHLALARSLFHVYRRRRIANTCQLFILDVLPVVTSAEPGSATPSANDVCGKIKRAAARASDEDGRCADDPLPDGALRVPELQDALAVLGKQGTAAIKLTFEKHEWDKWIPREWPEYCAEANQCNKHWEWGLFPVEFSARVMLDFLRLTQRLSDIRDSFDLLAECSNDPVGTKPVSQSDGKQTFSSSGSAGDDDVDRRFDWHDRDRPGDDDETIDSSPLPRLWRHAYSAIRAIERRKVQEQRKWEHSAVEFLCKIKSQIDDQIDAQKKTDATQAGVQFTYAADPKVFKDMLSFLETDRRRRACARLACRIAMVVKGTCEVAREIVENFDREGFAGLGCKRCEPGVTSHTKHKELNDLMCKQLEDLHDLVEFFEGKKGPHTCNQDSGSTGTEGPCHDDAKRSSAHSVLYRLLQLEVIQYSFNERDELTDDTLIELVQISGNSQGPLGKPGCRSQAKEKLLGIQVAHFAAFYKQSWRVNDWTYGRLDGSERLVKLLLNPERLQLSFTSPQEAVERIRWIAVESVDPGPLKDYLEQLWNDRKYEAGLREELKFLPNNKLPLPDKLPLCAEVITIRLHLGILRDELPHLVTAIEADRADGSDASKFSSSLVKLLGNAQSPVRFSPKEAAQAYCDGLISGERLVNEAGSDQFTRTLAHIVAATQRTLASGSAKLGPISGLSASLRVPILGFYLTARGLTRQSRTSAALNGALLVAGFVLVCLQFLWLPLTSPATTAVAAAASHAAATKVDPVAMPHILVTVGWLLFAYGLVISILRSSMLVLFGFVVVVLSLLLAPQFFSWVKLQGGWIFICMLLLLAYVSTKLVWLQLIVGFLVILAAGVAGSGEVNCLGTDLFAHFGFAGNCKEYWLASPSVWLSLVIILALVIAVIDLTALRRLGDKLRFARLRKK